MEKKTPTQKKPNHEEISDKHNLRDISQNNCLCSLKCKKKMSTSWKIKTDWETVADYKETKGT